MFYTDKPFLELSTPDRIQRMRDAYEHAGATEIVFSTNRDNISEKGDFMVLLGNILSEIECYDVDMKDDIARSLYLTAKQKYPNYAKFLDAQES